jgi:hypothetical protein
MYYSKSWGRKKPLVKPSAKYYLPTGEKDSIEWQIGFKKHTIIRKGNFVFIYVDTENRLWEYNAAKTPFFVTSLSTRCYVPQFNNGPNSFVVFWAPEY